MIKRTLGWIERVNKKYNIHPKTVLDIGSFDYNGNPKYLFPDSIYTGIDIQDGPNVDRVMSVYQISDLDLVDAVLCLNVFEHIENPWKAVHEINIVLKRGGYFYVSVPTFGFPKHDYPKDYWRMGEDAVRDVIMAGYNIISFESVKTDYGKHPIINCLGIKE